MVQKVFRTETHVFSALKIHMKSTWKMRGNKCQEILRLAYRFFSAENAWILV